MTIKTNFLTMHRKRCKVLQQDIAYLLNMDTGNLSRYEKGHRDPTPEIILTYHILFGASVIDLFHQQYKKVVEQLITRSKKLIAEVELEQSPKRKHRIIYLNKIVNRLNNDNHE